MNVSYKIDYLTVNIDSEEIAARVGPKWDVETWVQDKGMWGYDQCWKDTTTGVKKLRSSTRPDMGVCFTATGKAIDMVTAQRADNWQVRALDDYGFAYGRATRIDLTLDLFDDGMTTWLIKELLESGKIDCSARTMNVVAGKLKTSDGVTDGGLTCYLGARSSPRFLRIYDKNAESHGKVKATRFELEMKADYAQLIWRSLHTSRSPDTLKQAVKGTIKAFVPTFGSQAIDSLFAGDGDDWQPSPREDRDADTKAWLSRQVIPTIVKNYRETPIGENLLTWFNDAVTKRLNEEN